MAAAEELNTGELTAATMIDDAYEFSAPRFFDFIKGESEEDKRRAELWFDSALTYAPSPFMPRIRTGRSFTIESLCNFSEADSQKENSNSSSDNKTTDTSETKPLTALAPTELKQETKEENVIGVSADKGSNEGDKGDSKSTQEKESASATLVSPSDLTNDANSNKENCKPVVQVAKEAYTPISSIPGTNSKKHQTAKKIASLIRNPSALKPKTSHSKSAKPSSCLRSGTNVKNTSGTSNLAQENQAMKRQKLEGGRSRQIPSLKPPQVLPHKSKSGLVTGSSNFCPTTVNRTRKEDRKIYVREQTAAPFVSAAEMMIKFQSSTRDLSLPHVPDSFFKMKPRLTLTRPKEPELETSQRVRSVKVKSTAELEEEMMAKIPKFKARPLNKKIFEAPSLPAIPRSTPQPPEFKEFHFETMTRANHNLESASVASTEVSYQGNQWKPHLTEPKTPLLHTSLRARPAQVKSSLEIEKEELEKIPKFKAKPLNKKIFESKGELGVFCNVKKQITKPQEFHFATHERIPPPPPAVVDLFDKLSLNSEPRHEPLPRITTPNPFHLHTEERGAEKERKFITEVLQKQWEEERVRVPKANPYPYTTDYPVVPTKPEPKQCTRPEPFQLESLMRHEEEMQREMEERQKKEKEEAKMRIFKAQPVLKEDPIPVPEKVRKPLTQVQEISLHVDHRAVDRAEFDQKVKVKEMMYKRYREESDAARMIEEEKALKQLRRTLVPHARPVPNFDHPFCPQKSLREATKAKSPNLRVLQRKEKRRMMVNPAISSAAANMR
ncbi:hypothetical protein L484_010320 [Morus notabilis]|uniref:Protein TPX2 n=1 Tax=Morus notabilis TaxID=981085 RepID=W9QYK9_9ROSA|nr:protein TPX2 [Morus notabilis]EXB44629.1 hypothetical protein L484_010320 [Morus notabilis]